MSETTRLEKRTRELADSYMSVNPGVPRQEAKRRVRWQAEYELASQGISNVDQLVAEFEHVWHRY